MRHHRRYLFWIDEEGYVHARGRKTCTNRRAQTLCRRPVRLMQRSYDGSMFVDCPACLELIRRSVKSSMTTLWMQTHSGARPFPFSVKADEIQIEDIAHALANICRFGGHTKIFYSVGQHSLAASALAQSRGYSNEAALACLLHDAAEAYLGDVIRPIKRHPSMEIYCAAEQAVQRAVWERFGVTPTKEMRDIISEIDEQLIAIEAKELCGADESWRLNLSEWPRDVDQQFHEVAKLSYFNALHHDRTKQRFLETYYILTGDDSWATPEIQSRLEKLRPGLSH